MTTNYFAPNVALATTTFYEDNPIDATRAILAKQLIEKELPQVTK